MDNAIAAIVVTHQSAGTIGECLSRLRAAEGVAEIRIVDNDSRDGTLEIVQRHAVADPRVRFIANPDNPGFAVACNQGAADSQSPWLAFVNPDCFVEADSLARLRDRAASLGDALIGADLAGEDGARDAAARRRDPDFAAMLRDPSRAQLGVEIDSTQSLQPVEAVSGACMALPREVFAHLGGFDESYFLHVEDLDLCRRVRDAGLRVAIAHEIRVVHAGGSSSRHRPLFVARHKHRGMWRYFDKFDPAARSGWLRALVWSGIWLHFVVVAPLQALRAAWRRGRSAGRGRFTHG